MNFITFVFLVITIKSPEWHSSDEIPNVCMDGVENRLLQGFLCLVCLENKHLKYCVYACICMCICACYLVCSCVFCLCVRLHVGRALIVGSLHCQQGKRLLAFEKLKYFDWPITGLLHRYYLRHYTPLPPPYHHCTLPTLPTLVTIDAFSTPATPLFPQPSSQYWSPGAPFILGKHVMILRIWETTKRKLLRFMIC